MKFGCAVFVICEQTERRADMLITTLCTGANWNAVSESIICLSQKEHSILPQSVKKTNLYESA